MTIDLTGHLKTCRRSHPHEDMDEFCERYAQYERELASLRAEKQRAEAERDEAIRMRDRHAEASKAQNEDITALMAERDAALKDAERLDKANTELAQESCILRLVLGELVDAVNGTNDLDEMDGEEYQAASKRLDDAMAKAIPHTEEAIQKLFIDAARKGEQ